MGRSDSRSRSERPIAPNSAELRGYTHSVSFELIGFEHSYVDALHERYRVHEHWPEGLLCHVATFGQRGIHGVGIWTSSEPEQEYFHGTVLNVITDAIPDLGAPQVEGEVGTFEFVRRAIDRLAISSRCEAFADIGADSDGSAIHALGTEPVAVRFEYDLTAAEKHNATLDRLGYFEHLPADMLMLLIEAGEDSIFETQLWTAEGPARTELDLSYLPAVGGLESPGLPERLDRLSRISFDRAALQNALHE